MPVDPNYIHADTPHVRTMDKGDPYGCHNKPDVKGHWTKFQDGWLPDGRRRVRQVWVEFQTGRGCMHTGLSGLNKQNDPKCAGCRRKEG